jgi:hypothetical protein
VRNHATRHDTYFQRSSKNPECAISLPWRVINA